MKLSYSFSTLSESQMAIIVMYIAYLTSSVSSVGLHKHNPKHNVLTYKEEVM